MDKNPALIDLTQSQSKTMRKLILSAISTILALITVTGCETTLKKESMDMKPKQALTIHLKMSDEEKRMIATRSVVTSITVSSWPSVWC